MNVWTTWLSQRSPREQLGIRWALGLLVLVVLWQWALSPALQVRNTSEARRARLAQQTTQMQAMQQQVQQLRQQSRIPPEQAAQVLQSLAQAWAAPSNSTDKGSASRSTSKPCSPKRWPSC